MNNQYPLHIALPSNWPSNPAAFRGSGLSNQQDLSDNDPKGVSRQVLHPMFRTLRLYNLVKRSAMRCPEDRVKKPETRVVEDIARPSSYVRFNKRLIPVQQLNRHLIRACQKMMTIGNEMDKAYCLLLLNKLAIEEEDDLGFMND